MTSRPSLRAARTHSRSPSRCASAGGCDFAVDPALEYTDAAIFWLPQDDTSVVVLAAAPEELIVATPYEVLRFIGRGTSLRDYQRLKAALDRLQSTTVATSIRQHAEGRRHRFAGPQASSGIDAFIAEAAQRFALPAVWLQAIMRAESGGKPRAISPKGAMGRQPAGIAESGFGADVRESLHCRAEHLVSQGLAERRGSTLRFARNLIDTLRQRELDAVGNTLADESGKPFNRAAAGEYVAGTYRQRLTLASGRFAMLDDGLGFQLVPWTPALEKHLGRHVSGVARADGGIDWGFTRKRGLGL